MNSVESIAQMVREIDYLKLQQRQHMNLCKAIYAENGYEAEVRGEMVPTHLSHDMWKVPEDWAGHVEEVALDV